MITVHWENVIKGEKLSEAYLKYWTSKLHKFVLSAHKIVAGHFNYVYFDIKIIVFVRSSLSGSNRECCSLSPCSDGYFFVTTHKIFSYIPIRFCLGKWNSDLLPLRPIAEKQKAFWSVMWRSCRSVCVCASYIMVWWKLVIQSKKIALPFSLNHLNQVHNMSIT